MKIDKHHSRHGGGDALPSLSARRGPCIGTSGWSAPCHGPLYDILGLAGDAFFVVDASWRIVHVNSTAERLFGRDAAWLTGRPADDLFPERHHPLRALVSDGGAVDRLSDGHRIQALRHDGGEFPAELRIAPLSASGGSHAITVRDLTDREEAERRNAHLGRIIESAVNEIYVFDAESWRFRMVNQGARKNLGYGADELRALTPLDIAPTLTRNSLSDLLAPLLDGREEAVTVHMALQRRDGSTYEVEAQIQYMGAETPPVFVAILRDLTEKTTYETLIQRHAFYDPLTLLPNRKLFTERLAGAVQATLRDGALGAVLLISIGDLRLIDDTLGRDASDGVIQEAASRLEAALRPRDTLARISGREFAVIASHLDRAETASALATRILGVLESPFTIGSYRTLLTAHVGITLFPTDGANAQSLLRHADTALWGARRDGPGGYRFFTPDLNEAVKGRLALKSGLAGALDREEFRLAFQPQVDLSARRVHGVEALLRWRSPDLGDVSPAEFVPILEDMGLIVPVGDWVLEEACRQRRALKDAGHEEVRMAVNLSVRQVRPDFVDALPAVLARHGLTPRDLEFEITESVMMREGGQAVALLARMAEMGFALAIDDFGCGYSSLSHLRTLPLGTIKIDRSFITDLTVEPEDAEIVRAIIGMGRALKRRIIAEGVETGTQLERLRQMGCDAVQGFLFSRPLPSDRLLDFLGRGIQPFNLPAE